MLNIIPELFSGFVGVGLGFIGSILALKYKYKSLYARTVSNNRMIWIRNIRENAAKVISVSRCLWKLRKVNNFQSRKNERKNKNSYQGDKTIPNMSEDNCNLWLKEIELINEFEYHKSNILIRLNLSEPFHVLLSNLLNNFKIEEVLEDSTEKKLKNFELNLYEIFGPMLKEEWERVKDEAKGKQR